MSNYIQAFKTCSFIGHMQAQCLLCNQKYQQACFSYEIGFAFKRMVYKSNYGKRDRVFRHCQYLGFQIWTQNEHKNDEMKSYLKLSYAVAMGLV